MTGSPDANSRLPKLPEPGRSPLTPAPIPRQVLRCAGTADFLAALPQLTGFTAQDSVFVVLFSGNRSEGALRVDLPPDDDPLEVMDFLDGLCTMLHGLPMPSAPAVVITSSAVLAGSSGIHVRTFAQALAQRLHQEGLSPRELCGVAPDGWVSFLHGDDTERPRPLSEIKRSPVAAPASTELPDLYALGDLPQVPKLRRSAVRSELAHTKRPVLARHMMEVLDEAMRDDIDTQAPYTLAQAIKCTEGIDSWLVLAISIVLPSELRSEEVFATRPRFTNPHKWLCDISAAYVPAEKLKRATTLAMHLAAYAPVKRRAGCLALAAWLWWMRGLQSIADRLISRAVEHFPHDAVVTMVAQSVDQPVTRRFAPGCEAPEEQ